VGTAALTVTSTSGCAASGSASAAVNRLLSAIGTAAKLLRVYAALLHAAMSVTATARTV
jgi:hypothetical protein